CLKTQPATGETYPKSDLFNKAACWQPESSREAKTAAAIFFNVTLFSLWNRNGALISFAVRRRFAISGLF
ncbi:hypothetical protein, partial [Serratia marcescens]|uniref:hypothetical protein n=1 Tax=Serratia marcescens TaxID=615 RepID=UPI001E56C0EA